MEKMLICLGRQAWRGGQNTGQIERDLARPRGSAPSVLASTSSGITAEAQKMELSEAWRVIE